MDERDSFAQADQQVSALRERITRHRDAMERAKQRGHATAPAEAAQQGPGAKPSRVREAPAASL